MTNVAHSTLTGADLHEPKGVATALSGTIYVANGSGSGVWTDANAVIGNSAWSTGDGKLTLQNSAPNGWILVNDGTIGDGSSGGTTRANADTAALFTLLWSLPISLTVSGGRGASASADYAAHKTIQVPLFLGRALGIAGAGSGLTSRSVGQDLGAETYTQIRSDLPNVAPTFTGTQQTWNTNQNVLQSFTAANQGTTGPGASLITSQGAGSVTVTPSGTVQSLNGNVTQTSMSIMQPTTFLNLLIKL